MMDPELRAKLEAFRDERARHQQAANALGDQIRETIREELRANPTTANIRALSISSGLSRPTIYSLHPGKRTTTSNP